MRLTNEMRDDFVRSVMAALPWKNKLDDKRAKAEFERRAFALLPAEVIAMNKKYPGLLAMDSFEIQDMPRHDVVKVPGVGSWRYWNVNVPRIVDAKLVKFDDVRKQLAAHDEEEAQREERRLQLRGIAYSATTAETLEKVLPELAKFIPRPVKVAPAFPVVPAGFVEGLKKAGLKVTKASKAKAVAA